MWPCANPALFDVSMMQASGYLNGVVHAGFDLFVLALDKPGMKVLTINKYKFGCIGVTHSLIPGPPRLPRHKVPGFSASWVFAVICQSPKCLR